MAAEWNAPATSRSTRTLPLNARIGCGSISSASEPCPSWPQQLDPHEKDSPASTTAVSFTAQKDKQRKAARAPAAERASVCREPHEIVAMRNALSRVRMICEPAGSGSNGVGRQQGEQRMARAPQSSRAAAHPT
jgi:hypothetical protein